MVESNSSYECHIGQFAFFITIEIEFAFKLSRFSKPKKNVFIYKFLSLISCHSNWKIGRKKTNTSVLPFLGIPDICLIHYMLDKLVIFITIFMYISNCICICICISCGLVVSCLRINLIVE